MLKKLSCFAFVLLSLVTSAQSSSDKVTQFVNKIDQKIPQILEDFSIPGAAVAIIIEGEVVLQKGYGYADVKRDIKVDMQTGFNIGSISKPVAAWGVMKLVYQGKLDLDAPVEQYLTRWKLPDSKFESDQVTVRRLLSHTAGLSLSGVSAEKSFDDLPTITEWLAGENEGLGPLKIILEPGTKWEYSGGGYGLLQLIVEEVSGQKFEDYMQTEVLDSLGMYQSSFRINDQIMNASATPYDRFGEPTDFGLYTVQAAAGFHTTMGDFMRFALASLPTHNDHKKYNQILPVELVQQMLEPAPNTTIGGWKYGLGYQSVHMDNGTIFIGHAGTNNGWEANFRIDAVTQTGFIVFTNGGGGGNLGNPLFCEFFNWMSDNPSQDDCWPKLSIANKLVEIANKEGFEKIGQYYAKIKQERPDDFDYSESQLNLLGYHFLSRDQLQKAIAVFKLNTEIFPYNYNVYDSYAEALLAKGDKKAAIKNYKYSIRLNPENDNGIRILNNMGVALDDIHLQVPLKNLEQLAGTYKSAFGTDKTIQYAVVNGSLLRTYDDSDFTIQLVPIAQNEYVYSGRGIHVIFDTSNPDAIVLTVPGEGSFVKD